MNRKIALAILTLPIGVISLLAKPASAVVVTLPFEASHKHVVVAQRYDDHSGDRNQRDEARRETIQREEARREAIRRQEVRQREATRREEARREANRRVWIPGHWESGFLGIGRKWVEGHWEER